MSRMVICAAIFAANFLRVFFWRAMDYDRNNVSADSVACACTPRNLFLDAVLQRKRVCEYIGMHMKLPNGREQLADWSYLDLQRSWNHVEFSRDWSAFAVVPSGLRT